MARPMTAAQTVAAMTKWGVPYRQHPGWEGRGRPASTGPFSDVHGVMIHHTGSDAGQSDAYLRFLFVDGRSDLPGPLCHVATDMDGDLWLGATGRANHAGKGSGAVLNAVRTKAPSLTAELKPGPDDTDGNAVFYGNEVRYDGGQPMTPRQYAAATRWAAAICDHHDWTADAVIGHREWTRRKPDPGNCPMNRFRTDVAALLKAGPPSTEEELTVSQYTELKAKVDLLMQRAGPNTDARAQYAYAQVIPGGGLYELVKLIGQRVTGNTDARAQYAYDALVGADGLLTQIAAAAAEDRVQTEQIAEMKALLAALNPDKSGA